MSYESLDAQVQELATYAVNFSAEHYLPTERAICRAWIKCGNGNPREGWDYLRALRYMKKHLIDPAAKDYKREFGSMTQSWTDMWPSVIRQKATAIVLNEWLEEYEIGNVSIQ